MPFWTILSLALLALLAPSVAAGPPIARFQSVVGDFEVLLDPSSAPISVANFLSYANRSSYDSTIIHRSTTYDPSTIQIIQGGGFELVGNSIDPVATNPPIPLEAGVANTRGTLAMARTPDPDSATSQWFFNLTNNTGLDFDYAVFGRVIGTGISVVDAIGDLKAYNASQVLGSAFTELPLLGPELVVGNLVVINSVRVETFAITNFTRTLDKAELRWTALSTNTPVRIERSTTLAGPWTTIATNLTTGMFIDTNAPSRSAFYRLVTE